jgi:Gpi18-like mannosyltransferase
MTFLELCLLAVAVTSLVLSRWRISIPMLVSLLIFSALWYHGVRPVINGNASVLCALYITLAFWFITHEQDALAGLMLALASIKPQMVVLLIPFVILWAVSQRRWVLVWSIVVCIGFLVAIGVLFIPNWMWQNLIQLFAYPSYTLPGSPGAIFAAWLPGVGRQMGWVVTVFMAGILIWEWRAAWGKDLRWFLWAAYLTLTITNLIGIRTATENFIALFPGLVLVLAVWDERWGKLGRSLVVFSLILLFFGLWALFLVTLIPGDQPTQSPVMFFPLPIFMMIGLYWARWWAVRPPPPLLDQLRKTVEIG